ncbi:MAG: hypothetical protein PVJ49_00160 [Acidobacteriota bacterium]|jgi:hypothetical protein
MAPSALDEHGIRTFSGPGAWAGLAASTAVIVLGGLGMIWGVQRYLHALDVQASTSPDAAIARAGVALKFLAMVLGTLAVATALYTARSCARVLAARQIPPPGAWVLGTPTIITGGRAVIWGRVGYVLAGLLAIMGVMVTYMMWEFVNLMMSGVGTLGI